MAIRFQCSHCMDILKVTDTVAGRRIRCPLCETAIQVPAASPDTIFLDMPVSDQLARWSLEPYDRACAGQLLDLEMCEFKALRRGVLALRKKQTQNLLELLRSQGTISAGDRKAVHLLVKGAMESKKQEELSDCPNCFAHVKATAKKCPYCKQRLGELLIQDMCPNCKGEQPAGREWCRTCGANMETGLMPGVRLPRCPKCDHPVADAEALLCPRCRTRLDQSRAAVRTREYARVARNWWSVHSLQILLLAVGLAGLYAYTHWRSIRSGMQDKVLGTELAELYRRVDRMDQALRFNDRDGIRRLIDPTVKVSVDDALIATMLGAPGAKILSLESIEHPIREIRGDGQTADIYTKTEGYLTKGPAPDKTMNSSADIGKVARNLGEGNARLNGTIPWVWVYRNGKWYYAGPLPE